MRVAPRCPEITVPARELRAGDWIRDPNVGLWCEIVRAEVAEDVVTLDYAPDVPGLLGLRAHPRRPCHVKRLSEPSPVGGY